MPTPVPGACGEVFEEAERENKTTKTQRAQREITVRPASRLCVLCALVVLEGMTCVRSGAQRLLRPCHFALGAGVSAACYNGHRKVRFHESDFLGSLLMRMFLGRVVGMVFGGLLAAGLLGATMSAAWAAEAKPVSGASEVSDAAKRGFELLRTKPYAPADFTEEAFDKLWEVWPEELKQQAAEASPAERRKMAFSRYGLVADPENPDGPPLGVVDDGKGGWVMNCLACHQGKVAGKVVWGAGQLALRLSDADAGRAQGPARGRREAEPDGDGRGARSAGPVQRHDQRPGVQHGAHGACATRI